MFITAGHTLANAATLGVSWASNTEADLAGYRLRLGTAPGQYTQTIEVGTASSFDITDLATDVTYYLTVYAYDVAGNESVASAEVSARIPSSLGPLPVLESIVEVDSGSIYLIRGRSHSLVIHGRNIQEGAALDLGPGTFSTRTVKNASGDLTSVALVSVSAVPGLRTLTIINPDLGSASAADAFAVVKTPDTNTDCSVDIVDLNALARSWNVSTGEPTFSPASDLDGDAYVGPEDLTIFVKFLGQQLPWCP